MWQRFTESARKVVFYAQEEAQNAGGQYVSTEHFLLGICREPECRGAKILEACGVCVDHVREILLAQIPTQELGKTRGITLTPRAKRVIDLAYDEARTFRHNYIGTEHLVLALIREGDGLAGLCLAQLGMELARAEDVLRQFDAEGPETTKPSPKKEERDHAVLKRAWLSRVAHWQPMMSDQLCLMFLVEWDGKAAEAVNGCGVQPRGVISKIADEILARSNSKEPQTTDPSASEILSLASIQADGLRQPINGAHFLLAALSHGQNATARALVEHGISYESLKQRISDHP